MTYPNGQATYIKNGVSQYLSKMPVTVTGNTVYPPSTSYQWAPMGVEGLYDPPLCYYEWAPAAPDDELIASSQTITGTNSFVINTNTFVPGVPSQNSYQLDCPRSISITIPAIFGSNIVFQVSGYDKRNVLVTTNLTLLAGQTTVSSAVGFYGIVSARILTNTGNYSGLASIGTNNSITLPYFSCLKINHVIIMTYNAQPISPVTFLTPASNWRTTMPSLTSGDCKGLIDLPAAPTGTAVFSILYYVYGADSQLQAKLANGDQSSFTLIGAPTIPPYANPYPANTPPPLLVKQDATGIQYPGDLSIYNDLMNVGT